MSLTATRMAGSSPSRISTAETSAQKGRPAAVRIATSISPTAPRSATSRSSRPASAGSSKKRESRVSVSPAPAVPNSVSACGLKNRTDPSERRAMTMGKGEAARMARSRSSPAFSARAYSWVSTSAAPNRSTLVEMA